jgi:PTS system beta-glucosides-specific IIC component/PTS system sucrose-specific IIC component
MILAFGGAFIFTWILGFEEEPKAEAVIENSKANKEKEENKEWIKWKKHKKCIN